MHRYNDYLIKYAKDRVSDSHDAEGIVQEFWLIFLEKDKKGEYKICKFRGDALLKTYLTKFLRHKIGDKMRKISLDKEQTKNHHGIGEKEEPKELSDVAMREFPNEKSSLDLLCHLARLGLANPSPLPPDLPTRQEQREGVAEIEKTGTRQVAHEVVHEVMRKLVHETLLQLAETDLKCAFLVKMRFQGSSYEQILLRREPDARNLSKREIGKKLASLRKQHERCLKKSLEILNRVMKMYGLERDDLL